MRKITALYIVFFIPSDSLNTTAILKLQLQKTDSNLDLCNILFAYNYATESFGIG